MDKLCLLFPEAVMPRKEYWGHPQFSKCPLSKSWLWHSAHLPGCQVPLGSWPVLTFLLAHEYTEENFLSFDIDSWLSARVPIRKRVHMVPEIRVLPSPALGPAIFGKYKATQVIRLLQTHQPPPTSIPTESKWPSRGCSDRHTPATDATS